MSRQTPWLVLLCQFKDDLGQLDPALRYYTGLFTAPDLENAVTYWSDVTYGELHLTGSEVRIVRLNKSKADYKGSGSNFPGRQDLVDRAKKAAAVDLSK